MKILSFVLLTIVATAMSCNHKLSCKELDEKVNKLVVGGKIVKASDLVLKADCPEVFDKYVKALSNLALTKRLFGNNEGSVLYYKEALYVISKDKRLGQNNPKFLRLNIELANLYDSMGNSANALEIYLMADQGYLTKHLDDPSYVNILGEIATRYEHFYDHLQAWIYYERIANWEKKKFGDKSIDYASGLYDVARLNIKMHDYDLANTQADTIMSIIKDTSAGNAPLFARCLHLFAAIELFKKNPKKALDIHIRAMNIIKAHFGEDHPEYKAMFQDLSAFYDENGDYQNAIQSLEKAKDFLYDNGEDKSLRYGEYLMKIAAISYKMGDFRTSVNSVNEADEIFKSEVSKTIPFLTYTQKESFILRGRTLLELKCNIAHQNKSVALNSSIFDDLLFLKNLQLNDELRSLIVLRSAKDTSIELLQKIRDSLQDYLNYQHTLPIAKQDPSIKNIKKSQIIQRIEQALSTKAAQMRMDIPPQDFHASGVHSKLSKSDAAIEFFNFRYLGKKGWTDSILYAALVLTPNNNMPEWIYLFEESQLKKLFVATNDDQDQVEMLYNPLNTRQVYYGNDLYSLIWGKIERSMSGIHRIYYSPAGILNNVAFAAISIPHQNKRLCDLHHDLIQLASTRSITSTSDINQSVHTAALFAPIEFNANNKDEKDNNWDNLPQTKNQVETLNAFLSSEKMRTSMQTYSNASEKSVKSLGKHPPDILYIATHGFFAVNSTELQEQQKNGLSTHKTSYFDTAKNPMIRSGLVMSANDFNKSGYSDLEHPDDGILTAQEISQINLNGTLLVFLSACRSGLGDAINVEGVYGLQRAFKIAGAQYIICTLWNVRTNESTEFVNLFYKKWISEKKSIRTAFYETQEIQRKKYSNEPYKWASFVLIE